VTNTRADQRPAALTDTRIFLDKGLD